MQYPTRQFIGSKEKAIEQAEWYNDRGGLAWTEPEFANEMGHTNVFQGYRVCYFTNEDIRLASEAVRRKLRETN